MPLSATAIIEDIKLPDYKGRHVFTAKLRLAIFVLFWVIGIFYFKTLWKNAPWVPLIISLAFLVTGLCYQNILKNRHIFASFVIEMLADLISVSVLIYLTGGQRSEYFTLYIMYCIAAGVFYNHQVAVISTILTALCYGVLVLMLTMGWIPEFSGSVEFPSWMRNDAFGQYGRFFLLVMFLPVAVYVVKISNFFSRLKQGALEERNKQLIALNRISSTIRRVMSPKQVMQQVLAGVVEGLGYDLCLLVMMNKPNQRIDFYIPKENAWVAKLERITGFKLDEMFIPQGTNNSIFNAILRNRVVFRHDLASLVTGIQPTWSEAQIRRVQEELGFQRYVIMPLVAERRVIGSLIGISRTEFIDESRVSVLENFSNQAALAIESAQLFEELKNKNLELERANKIKGEFLAIMSHELRTPLTAIIGFSELLMEEVLGELKDEQKDSLREVINNGEHLLHLINSILDLSKVEAGKIELIIEPFNLSELTQDVKASIAPLIKRKAQSFHLEVEEPLPLFHADARKVRQILLNLFSNAIKFTPEHGNITLRVRYLESLAEWGEKPQLAALPAVPEGYIEFCVRDDGIGIEAKDLNNVFNVFEQIDSSFTRKYQGTGLGLSLTKQFVELHHGVIWVESEPGQGSKFWILIPVKVPETPKLASSRKLEPIVLGVKQMMQGSE